LSRDDLSGDPGENRVPGLIGLVAFRYLIGSWRPFGTLAALTADDVFARKAVISPR